MPAFIIVDVTIHDPEAYETYKQLTPASIAAFGGRFVARGGATECLEGDWHPQRLVILEFPTMEQAKSWWDSEQYRPARDIRWRVATSRMLLVEGLPLA